MKAMMLRAPNSPLALETLDTPKPGPDDALVRVFACGSGLTLHHAVTGKRSARLPVILGHEVVGEVVECGAHARGLAVGDLVTLHPLLYCGRCRYCLTNREPLCEESGGMIGRDINGGYAEYMTAPDRNWFKLPYGLLDQYDPTVACVINDALVTPYKVTRLSRLQPMETCVIYGAAGGVGIHLIEAAKLRGARVIGIDRGEHKIAAISALGAHDAIDAEIQDPVQELKRLTDGRGADVVADFVGTSETLANGVAMLGKGGRLVIVGLSPHSEGMISAPAAPILTVEQSILGSRAFSRQELNECLSLVARGLLKPIVNHVYPLAEANEAHALVGRGGNIGRVVLKVA